MCTIIISKLLGSVVAPWRPLLAQTTRLPCPDQQAQTQAQAQAWVRMQPPLQLRASWQPTSAVQHARSFWRPSRPWAATWTCVACRPCPRGDAAWRLVTPQGRGKGEEKGEVMQRESGGGCGSPFYLLLSLLACFAYVTVTAAARCSLNCPLLLCLLAPARTGIRAETRRSSSTQDCRAAWTRVSHTEDSCPSHSSPSTSLLPSHTHHTHTRTHIHTHTYIHSLCSSASFSPILFSRTANQLSFQSLSVVLGSPAASSFPL